MTLPVLIHNRGSRFAYNVSLAIRQERLAISSLQSCVLARLMAEIESFMLILHSGTKAKDSRSNVKRLEFGTIPF